MQPQGKTSDHPNSGETAFRSGYACLIGRPNVGKSTLLNAILGEKIAIVTAKPQTTRKRITGIRTLPEAQIIFVDTPGIHRPLHRLGEIMVKEARESMKNVDVVLFLVEPVMPGAGNRLILDLLRDVASPVFLVINKADTVKKPRLLPVIEAYRKLYAFREIIPLSALTGDGVDLLVGTIVSYLPEGPRYYPDDLVTDQLERFMVAEIIREKAMELTEKEVPFAIATEIMTWQEREDGIILIGANIYIEREGQKGIIIGKGGSRLKAIGTSAREEIEGLLGAKVHLSLWVKMRKDWRSNNQFLKELGFA